ncbi:LysM peptidoglycan-binding domain-containing protein [Brevibacterium sp. GP-SGM9]|uniref:LysM peptidoglycan-binding domain-containing protein n=1 Tax=Brevibacterium sp. GP-SGM9 TaxID=3376990 RepID=UPI0039A5FF5C
MHLLIACAGSWLALLGAFAAALIGLPAPRSATDTVVIVVIGAAALVFSRLGLGAVLALAVRLLPAGRLRSVVITAMLRIMPIMLRSTALAAASATLALQSAHGAPVHESPPHTDLRVTAPAAVDASATDTDTAVGAPTAHPDAAVDDSGLDTDAAVDDSGSDTDAAVDDSGLDTDAAVDDAGADTGAPLPDPGWPTSPSDDAPPRDPGWPTDAPAAGDSPVATPPSEDSPRTPPDGDDDADESSDTDPRASGVHVVNDGESLWSIAADRAAPNEDTDELVAEIYANNRDRIGPNPNLIMPGQRLEIAP